MSGRSLILGMAAGYHYGDVRPFAASLWASGFAGRCVLFVSPTTRDAARMEAHGLETIPFERPDYMAHLPLNAWRHFLCLNFLRDAGRAYERVLFTDVRDVVFQSDPLARPWPGGVSAVLEADEVTVGGCAWTSRWLRLHLGEDALAAVAARPLSCSGTVVAPHAAMVDYLERMTALLVPFAPGPNMAGFDQGVHNCLVHGQAPGGPLPEVHFTDNAGPVLTLGHRHEPPAVDAAGNVFNDAGVPAVMVHQYDRHPGLFKQVRERWMRGA